MIKTNLEKDTLTFEFLVRMDSKNSLEAENEINKEIERNEPKKIVFDLAKVDYIASAFLRICITVAKKIGKEKFAVINTQPQIKKIFKMSGLEGFFDIT